MPAFEHEVEQAMCEGVEPLYLTAPVSVKTGADGKVTGLECQKMELGEPDKSGRRRPVPVEGSNFILDVDMIIPAIGQRANTSIFEGTGLEITKWSTIEVDEITFETNLPGVFAAGDVQTGPWIAVGAIGDGEKAAVSIDRYLRRLDQKEGRIKKRKRHHRPKTFPVGGVVHPRAEMPTLPPEYTCSCFDEIATGFTQESAQAEATRCLNCYSDCLEKLGAPGTSSVYKAPLPRWWPRS